MIYLGINDKNKSHISQKLGKKKELTKTKKSSKLQEEEKEYKSKEEEILEIPSVPEAPKKNKKITLQSSDLSSEILQRIKKVESPDIKVVLVNCNRCKAIIPIPVVKKVVLNSELPIVPISYVHKNLVNQDLHCITIHVDHDFDIRRQRISEVIIASD